MIAARARLAGGALFAVVASIGAVALAIVSANANADEFDPRHAQTIVVGTPKGHSITTRGNVSRSGSVRAPLPSRNLRLEWRKWLGASIDGPPAVHADGSIDVAVARGEVVTLDAEGNEKYRVASNVAQPGPGSLLSDGTYAFLSGNGEIVGVRDGAVRFRERIGRGDAIASRLGILPLADGGAVIAGTTELILVDGAGEVRTRVPIAEPPELPLLSFGERVLSIGQTGSVYVWPLGSTGITRFASFPAAVDGAALIMGKSLVGVTAHQRHIASIDLETGAITTRAVSAGSAVFVGPPAAEQGLLSVVLAGPNGTSAATFDANGKEQRVVPLTHVASSGVDGGTFAIPSELGLLVDSNRTVAFPTAEGQVGVVAADGTLERIGEPICSRPGAMGARPSSMTPVLASGGLGAFLAACPGGHIARIGEAASNAAPPASRRGAAER